MRPYCACVTVRLQTALRFVLTFAAHLPLRTEPQALVRCANWRERLRRSTKVTQWALQGLIDSPELATAVAMYEVRAAAAHWRRSHRLGSARWLLFVPCIRLLGLRLQTESASPLSLPPQQRRGRTGEEAIWGVIVEESRAHRARTRTALDDLRADTPSDWALSAHLLMGRWVRRRSGSSSCCREEAICAASSEHTLLQTIIRPCAEGVQSLFKAGSVREEDRSRSSAPADQDGVAAWGCCSCRGSCCCTARQCRRGGAAGPSQVVHGGTASARKRGCGRRGASWWVRDGKD